MFSPNTIRLSIMMFLQFFVWGAWYVSMTGYINDKGMAALTGAAYTVGPIAAIVAPFFLGMIADRFFASEKVLGVLHLLGGVFLLIAPSVAQAFTLDSAPEDASLFYRLVLHDLPAYVQPFTLLLLLHMLCYMPTIGLTTSLSFHNLENPEKQFPLVRVAGTIGWIAGNIAVSFLPDKDVSSTQFYMAGSVAILLGLYSFTLPHTPPPSKGQKITAGKILGTDSLRLFRNPSYAVFMICSFLICIPLAGYYAMARNFVEASNAVVNDSATFTMSFGQMSEVIFMLVMPLFFARLGIKWMLVAGMAAWVLRYALFALGADDQVVWMILLGVILHGICYDFFFVTGMIYVDKKAPRDIRHQAQGFLVLVTQGLGLGIGAKLFFAHVMMNTKDNVSDWYTIWLYPAVFAGVIMVAFAVLFRDQSDEKSGEATSS
ncbi:MAG: nucleoside permease [Pirellulales bacterium]